MDELTYKEGDTITFLRIKRHRNYTVFPAETTYSAEQLSGIVINIRDTSKELLSRSTVSRRPEVERSRYLITVKTEFGLYKIYHGCMVGVFVNPFSDVIKALRAK